MGYFKVHENLLLHAKEMHKVRENLVKKRKADARAQIELIDKDIRKLKKQSKASGRVSKSKLEKLEELEALRENIVQYLRDTKLPKLIDSVKACGADFEKVKKDILENIKGEPEEELFLTVFSNLEKFIPQKRTPQEELNATNLLESIINLHGIGKGYGRMSGRERTIRTASKTTKDEIERNIKEYEISSLAHAIIKLENKKAEQMKRFINEHRSEYIKWDGKKFIVKKRATRDLKPETLFQFDREIKLARLIVNKKKVWEETYEKEMGKKPDRQAYYRHTQRIF